MAHNSFEHKIQKKFEGYAPQPPAHVWNNIQDELSGKKSTRHLVALFYEHKSMIISVAAGIAATAILLLYIFNFSDRAGQNNMKPEGVPITEDSSNRNKADQPNSAKQADDSTKPSLGERKAPGSINIDTTPEKPSDSDDKISNDSLNNTQDDDATHPGGMPLDIDTYIREKNADVIAQLSPYQKSRISLSQQAETLSRYQSEKFDYQPQKSTLAFNPEVRSAHGSWSFGLYATPELLMSRSPIMESHSNYSADAAIMYSFDKFFVQSGVSYLSGNNNQNINVDYLKYNYLGSYEDVYEVTFDSLADGSVKPNYHTKTVELYDTLHKRSTTRFENEYRYLNFPVLIGYKNNVNNNLTFSLKGGPIISFILRDNRKIMFNQPNTDITGMNAPDPMVKTNWQALISAGLEYHITHSVHLAVEPRMKYYFNPVYNIDGELNRKKPYSLGVRTGLVFDF